MHIETVFGGDGNKCGCSDSFDYKERWHFAVALATAGLKRQQPGCVFVLTGLNLPALSKHRNVGNGSRIFAYVCV